MHTLPLLPTAVIFHCFRHAVTLSHHRTASSPRRLSRYSDHAAVARLQLYHTAAAGASEPLRLPLYSLLVPPAPSSLAPVNNKRPGPAAATSPTAATPATATPPLRPRRRLATPAAAARQTLRPKGEGGGCRPPQSLNGRPSTTINNAIQQRRNLPTHPRRESGVRGVGWRVLRLVPLVSRR